MQIIPVRVSGMSKDSNEVVKWLKQILVPVSAIVENRLRDEDVDFQAMHAWVKLCDAELLQLGFHRCSTVAT
jgi:hypothetical protein